MKLLYLLIVSVLLVLVVTSVEAGRQRRQINRPMLRTRFDDLASRQSLESRPVELRTFSRNPERGGSRGSFRPPFQYRARLEIPAGMRAILPNDRRVVRRRIQTFSQNDPLHHSHPSQHVFYS